MRRFSFFDNISKNNQVLLLNSAKFVTMPKGMELFSQGYVCNNILFLTDGTVRVFRRHISGQEITLYFLEEFEQCNVNLNSAFTKSPAIGTAVSQSEISGYMIPPQIVKKLYIEEDSYQDYVFNLYANRLEVMATLIEEVKFDKLDDRVERWLTQNAEDGKLKITHEELANHLGSSREAISRILKTFEKNGSIELKRGEIVIL